MPTADIGGIATNYELRGSGPPLLMFSPGGFSATLENWTEFGVYRELDLVRDLSAHYTCIMFDRRESGRSGGRVERIQWRDYADQGKGLLDHLGVETAPAVGGCAGCSVALAMAVAYPSSVSRAVLYWPAGGARYALSQQARFRAHLSWVDQAGLDGVADLAASSDRSFSQDPRVGPWAGLIRADPEFACTYRAQSADRYRLLVVGMARTLFDRDTVPGVEPEDLLGLQLPTLIVPGHDASHATSAARYLEECLPLAHYWDVPVAGQDRQSVARQVLAFLADAS